MTKETPTPLYFTGSRNTPMLALLQRKCYSSSVNPAREKTPISKIIFLDATVKYIYIYERVCGYERKVNFINTRIRVLRFIHPAIFPRAIVNAVETNVSDFTYVNHNGLVSWTKMSIIDRASRDSAQTDTDT